MRIDSGLVSRLVAAQFPQWARLPVTPVELDGWDNRTFRLGYPGHHAADHLREYLQSVLVGLA